MNGIGNQIAQFVFNQLIKQNFIKGHRMYLGGAIAIGGGLGLILEMLVNQQYDDTKMAMAWAGIALGYKTIGEAGKADAQTKALLVAAKTEAIETKVAANVLADDKIIRTREVINEVKDMVS